MSEYDTGYNWHGLLWKCDSLSSDASWHLGIDPAPLCQPSSFSCHAHGYDSSLSLVLSLPAAVIPKSSMDIADTGEKWLLHFWGSVVDRRGFPR